MTNKFDIKLFEDVTFDGIDHRDYPDYCNAFILDAMYDGRILSDDELNELNEDAELVYELLTDK
tara:strand:- start:473 stop:664 length:192 start_codon:yes stop_codon:yes gene_type:complete